MLSFSPANETTYVCSGVVRSGKVSGTKVFDIAKELRRRIGWDAIEICGGSWRGK
jgi:hypothetical protein